jgi:glycosyltransferase involved in cell wall biosynthesis
MKNSISESRINWRIEGPFDSTYSLALLNREIARALKSLDVNVVLHSTEGPGDFSPSEKFLSCNNDLKEMHERVNFFTPSDCDVVSRNLYPPRVADMNGKKNLMHSYAWEETGFPRQWVEDFNSHLQGLTCLSQHVYTVMQNNGVQLPMSVSGCGVDHWDRITSSGRNVLHGLSARNFCFLHVSSFFPRKGPEALLESYGDAFSDDDDVSLIIKTFSNPHNEVNILLNRYRSLNKKYPHVILIEDDFSDSDLKALYECCDVLVAPSCAEGFGLPLAEAMLSGLPVITTAWSGQLDFCNSENSWLVDFNFEQAKTHFNLLPSAWAAIDKSRLSQAMLLARETSKEMRSAMASKGRSFLYENFTWTKVAQRLIDFYQKLKNTPHLVEPKIGWISTWNVKCGIATYSEHLLQYFDISPIVLAARDASILREDDRNCKRCWGFDAGEDFSDICTQINNENLDVLVVQFNFGFFNHEKLTQFFQKQKAAGRILIVDLHATIDPPHAPEKCMKNYVEALALCDRLLVHSIADMNRMKAFGLESLLTLFPHGILEIPEPVPLPLDHVPTIATYGFCLPHKGLLEVLQAVALLRDQGKRVDLNMVNAVYPIDFSHALMEELHQKVVALKLENQVKIESRFLPDEDSLDQLQSADLIVFAYHPTSESASGAVRYGLACGRPTLVTDIPIFEELGDTVWRVDGHTPAQLAERIWEVLKQIEMDTTLAKTYAENAKLWRDQHRYSSLSKRLSGIILGIKSNKI